MVTQSALEDKIMIPSTQEGLIIRGVEVIAMEHDQMRKFARLERRVPKECLQRCLDELAAFPEEAEKAYYRLPRKSKQCNHRSNVSCKTCNWIEGPSVGTARTVARNWGNCTVGVTVLEDTDDSWYLEGRFLDFETNYSATRCLRVSKIIKWSGKTQHVSELGPTVEFQIFQAGVSKCYRNVVRDGIPEPIINRHWAEAKRLVAGKTPGRKLSKDAIKRVVTAFEKHKVTQEMLEMKLDKTTDKWTGNDAVELKGYHTAIEEGHSTTQAIFGVDIQEPEPEPEPDDEEYEHGPDEASENLFSSNS